MRGTACLTNHPEYFMYIKKLVDQTGAVAYNLPRCREMASIQSRAEDSSLGTLSCTWIQMHWLCISAHQRGEQKELRGGEAINMGAPRRNITFIFLDLLQNGSVSFCSLKD